MLPPVVRKYLEEHRGEHLDALMDLLAIPSIANVAPPPDSCLQAAEWIAGRLERLGFSARVEPLPGGRPNVVAEATPHPDRVTVLFYAHYDVQPPDPLDPWQSPPFEPEVRDGKLYARGASDDKGPLLAHLMALEAWQEAGGGLPVNVKVFVEGEEEIGSPHLEPWLATHADQLACDAAVISDSEFFAPDLPSITYALRGLCYFQVTLRAQQADVHSGIHGGALVNPANALARMLAALHDDEGRVTIPGFYDDVVELSDAEREAWDKLPFDEAEYAASLGLAPEALGGGERAYSVLERRWARPTLDCNGFLSGYTGPGSKTIIPAEASAKLSMRLVAHQDPERIEAALRRFLRERTPTGLTLEIDRHAAARPVLLDPDAPIMQAGREAMKLAFGREPAMIRCGASVPITELFQRILGVEPVLMGFGLPDDNLHSPNEKFDLDQLWRGSLASAALLGRLGFS